MNNNNFNVIKNSSKNSILWMYVKTLLSLTLQLIPSLPLKSRFNEYSDTELLRNLYISYIKNCCHISNFFTGQNPDCDDYLKVSGRKPVKVIR